LTQEDQGIAGIWAKRSPDQLFLADEPEPEPEQPESDPEMKAINQIYAREHGRSFSPFAYNEAVLFDLENNGPLPYIDETSTEEDIARGIQNLQKRVECLKAKIESLGGEV
jgi:hypothetical protein